MLWLPGSHADALIHEATETRIKLFIEGFNKELQAVDGRLSCFLQTQNIDILKAGFWYIKRENENGTTSLWAVENPDGTHRVPDDAVLNWLRSNDLRRRGAKEARFQEHEKKKERVRKSEAEKSREFREKLTEKAKFIHDTPSRPKPWRNSKKAA